MDLANLKALQHVVDCGSLQRAASSQRVSRNVVRRQIDQLEEQVGVPLLRREARGVSLTPAGVEVIERAGPLLLDAAALIERARDASEEARGVLRFILPTGIPAPPRAQALLALRRLHPDLDVEVVEVEDPSSMVGEPFDLMFHLGEFGAPPGWFSHVIMRVPVQLRASDSYLEAHGEPASVDALSEHTLLQWAVPGEQQRGLPLKRKRWVETTPWLRTANISLLLELAHEGAGLVFGPVFPRALEGAGELKVVLDGIVGGTATLRALSPQPSRVDPRVRAMLKNAQRLLKTMGA